MSSGRHGTDYRPVCEVNQMIQQQNKIQSQHDYRLFLQRNGRALLKLSEEHMNSHYGCPQSYFHVDPNGHLPQRQSMKKHIKKVAKQ